MQDKQHAQNKRKYKLTLCRLNTFNPLKTKREMKLKGNSKQQQQQQTHSKRDEFEIKSDECFVY